MSIYISIRLFNLKHPFPHANVYALAIVLFEGAAQQREKMFTSRDGISVVCSRYPIFCFCRYTIFFTDMILQGRIQGRGPISDILLLPISDRSDISTNMILTDTDIYKKADISVIRHAIPIKFYKVRLRQLPF